MLIFKTIHDCSQLFALFETIHAFHITHYSGLFAICVFQTPVQNVDNAIQWINHSSVVVSTLIHWTAIYMVDSVIQPSNNGDQRSDALEFPSLFSALTAIILK